MSDEEFKTEGMIDPVSRHTSANCCSNEEIYLFAGAAALVFACMVASYWIPEYRTVAGVQFGAIVGAAAMRMRGA